MSDELVVRQGQPSLAPQNFNDALTFSKLLSQSAFVPRDFRGKPNEILAAIQYGFELGVGPMQALQNIAVINGKPSVYGDLALALVQASGKLEYIKESDDGAIASCEVKRRDNPHPHCVTFSNDDAKRAGLLGKSGPWTQYPARMRQFRARGFALRDMFADVLKGLITREEAEDYPTPPSYGTDPKPEDENQAALSSPDDVATLAQRSALRKVATSWFGDQAKGDEWLKTQGAGKGMTVSRVQQLTQVLLEKARGTENQEPRDPELDMFKTADEKVDPDVPF